MGLVGGSRGGACRWVKWLGFESRRSKWVCLLKGMGK